MAPADRLCDVNNRDDDGRLSRPFVATARGVDRAAGLADRPQAGGAGVALADRVGGEEAEAAAVAQQPVSAAKEMRDDVGIAVRARMQGLEPIEVVLGVDRDRRRSCRRRAGCRRSRRSRGCRGRRPRGIRAASGTARRAACRRASRSTVVEKLVEPVSPALFDDRAHPLPRLFARPAPCRPRRTRR